MTTLRPRGPLPARVYWVRRLLVLGVAVALVAGLARLLGGGSDGSSDQESAALAGASSSASAAEQDPSGSVSVGPTPRATPSATPSSTAPTLAEPSGPCADREVAVTPTVPVAVAGPRHGARIVLEVRSLTSEACTWRVSPRSLTVKITSGRDAIWSTQHCPRAVPTDDLIVRRDVPAEVTIVWNARRSDEDCSRRTEWALPGYYHVTAAALTGEPADAQFRLLAPTAPTVTRTAEPKQAEGKRRGKAAANPKNPKNPKKSPGSGGAPGTRPTDQPTGTPSGAVEP